MRLSISHKWRRVWSSGSPILLATIPVVLAAIPVLVSGISSPETTTKPSSAPIPISITFQHTWVLLIGVLAAAVLLAMRWRSEYRRRTFDPTWVLKFGDTFDSGEMKKTRAAAARDLKRNASKLGDTDYLSGNIDDVLDFFDDLGFYVQGDQLTPEVTHHAFYYWVRGYYLAARPYLEHAQIDRPNQWQWVPWLFEATHELETKNNHAGAKRNLSDSEMRQFIAEEANLLSQRSPGH